MSTAVGGRGAARYRLTPWYLYWETGFLTSNGQQVPLFAVGDVDVRQSMTQKARRMGDLVINAGPQSMTMTSIREPHRVRDLLMQAVHQAVGVHRSQQNTSTHFVAQVPPAPAAPSNAGSADEILSQLQRLGELRDAGIVTEQEFQAKKTEMLGRL